MFTAKALGAVLLLVGAATSPALAQSVPSTALVNVAAPVDDAALGAIAGREDAGQVAFANQIAGVSASSVGDHVATGEAHIGDQAFQNVSGLSIVNVNTGNNVAINAAMNVNISLTPGP